MHLIKRKYWLEILLHILVWVAIFYVLGVIGSLSSFTIRIQTNHGGMMMQRDVKTTLHPYSFVIIGFLMLLFYSNAFWLFKKTVKWRNGYQQIAVVAAWFAFIFFVDYFVVGYLLDFHRPAAPNLQRMGIPEFVRNSWWHMQVTILMIFLFTLGSSVAYFFSKAWVNNELIRKQLAAHQLSTEIKFLKSQINPHFLFNTLNNLFSMAQNKGNDELAEGISKLSEMMRYMIYESNAEMVPVAKEIEYLENCILLNKLRYADDEVKVIFNYPADVTGLFIAPMIFVPFVENAFKHGVLIGRSSSITITIAVHHKQLAFSCENQSYRFVKKMDDDSGGIGLDNVKRRLELMYPDNHELVIRNDHDQYSVELKINLA